MKNNPGGFTFVNIVVYVIPYFCMEYRWWRLDITYKVWKGFYQKPKLYVCTGMRCAHVRTLCDVIHYQLKFNTFSGKTPLIVRSIISPLGVITWRTRWFVAQNRLRSRPLNLNSLEKGWHCQKTLGRWLDEPCVYQHVHSLPVLPHETLIGPNHCGSVTSK